MHTEYLSIALRPGVIAKAFPLITQGVEFNLLVGTGLSGIIPLVAIREMHKANIAIVRKEVSNHCMFKVEDTFPRHSLIADHVKWLFVDDFVASGETPLISMNSYIGLIVKEVIRSTVEKDPKFNILTAIEHLAWITKALVHSAIPASISWKDFTAELTAGVEEETKKQKIMVDKPDNAVKIVTMVYAKHREQHGNS